MAKRKTRRGTFRVALSNIATDTLREAWRSSFDPSSKTMQKFVYTAYQQFLGRESEPSTGPHGLEIDFGTVEETQPKLGKTGGGPSPLWKSGGERTSAPWPRVPELRSPTTEAADSIDYVRRLSVAFGAFRSPINAGSESTSGALENFSNSVMAGIETKAFVQSGALVDLLGAWRSNVNPMSKTFQSFARALLRGDYAAMSAWRSEVDLNSEAFNRFMATAGVGMADNPALGAQQTGYFPVFANYIREMVGWKTSPDKMIAAARAIFGGDPKYKTLLPVVDIARDRPELARWADISPRWAGLLSNVVLGATFHRMGLGGETLWPRALLEDLSRRIEEIPRAYTIRGPFSGTILPSSAQLYSVMMASVNPESAAPPQHLQGKQQFPFSVRPPIASINFPWTIDFPSTLGTPQPGGLEQSGIAAQLLSGYKEAFQKFRQEHPDSPILAVPRNEHEIIADIQQAMKGGQLSGLSPESASDLMARLSARGVSNPEDTTRIRVALRDIYRESPDHSVFSVPSEKNAYYLFRSGVSPVWRYSVPLEAIRQAREYTKHLDPLRNKLVEQEMANLPVWIAPHTGKGVPVGDLLQEARLALIEAASTWDPGVDKRGNVNPYSFAPYAATRVKFAVRRAVTSARSEGGVVSLEALAGNDFDDENYMFEEEAQAGKVFDIEDPAQSLDRILRGGTLRVYGPADRLAGIRPGDKLPPALTGPHTAFYGAPYIEMPAERIDPNFMPGYGAIARAQSLADRYSLGDMALDIDEGSLVEQSAKARSLRPAISYETIFNRERFNRILGYADYLPPELREGVFEAAYIQREGINDVPAESSARMNQAFKIMRRTYNVKLPGAVGTAFQNMIKNAPVLAAQGEKARAAGLIAYAGHMLAGMHAGPSGPAVDDYSTDNDVAIDDEVMHMRRELDEKGIPYTFYSKARYWAPGADQPIEYTIPMSVLAGGRGNPGPRRIAIYPRGMFGKGTPNWGIVMPGGFKPTLAEVKKYGTYKYGYVSSQRYYSMTGARDEPLTDWKVRNMLANIAPGIRESNRYKPYIAEDPSIAESAIMGELARTRMNLLTLSPLLQKTLPLGTLLNDEAWEPLTNVYAAELLASGGMSRYDQALARAREKIKGRRDYLTSLYDEDGVPPEQLAMVSQLIEASKPYVPPPRKPGAAARLAALYIRNATEFDLATMSAGWDKDAPEWTRGVAVPLDVLGASVEGFELPGDIAAKIGFALGEYGDLPEGRALASAFGIERRDAGFFRKFRGGEQQLPVHATSKRPLRLSELASMAANVLKYGYQYLKDAITEQGRLYAVHPSIARIVRGTMEPPPLLPVGIGSAASSEPPPLDVLPLAGQQLLDAPPQLSPEDLVKGVEPTMEGYLKAIKGASSSYFKEMSEARKALSAALSDPAISWDEAYEFYNKQRRVALQNEIARISALNEIIAPQAGVPPEVIKESSEFFVDARTALDEFLAKSREYIQKARAASTPEEKNQYWRKQEQLAGEYHETWNRNWQAFFSHLGAQAAIVNPPATATAPVPPAPQAASATSSTNIQQLPLPLQTSAQQGGPAQKAKKPSRSRKKAQQAAQPATVQAAQSIAEASVTYSTGGTQLPASGGTPPAAPPPAQPSPSPQSPVGPGQLYLFNRELWQVTGRVGLDRVQLTSVVNPLRIEDAPVDQIMAVTVGKISPEGEQKIGSTIFMGNTPLKIIGTETRYTTSEVNGIPQTRTVNVAIAASQTSYGLYALPEGGKAEVLNNPLDAQGWANSPYVQAAQAAGTLGANVNVPKQALHGGKAYYVYPSSQPGMVKLVAGGTGDSIEVPETSVIPYNPATQSTASLYGPPFTPPPAKPNETAWSSIPRTNFPHRQGAPWKWKIGPNDQWGYINTAIMTVEDTMQERDMLLGEMTAGEDILEKQIAGVAGNRPKGILSRVLGGESYSRSIKGLKELADNLDVVNKRFGELSATVKTEVDLLRDRRKSLMDTIESAKSTIERLSVGGTAKGAEGILGRAQAEKAEAEAELGEVDTTIQQYLEQSNQIGAAQKRLAKLRRQISTLPLEQGGPAQRMLSRIVSQPGLILFGTSLAQWYAVSPQMRMMAAFSRAEEGALGAYAMAGVPVSPSTSNILGMQSSIANWQAGVGEGLTTIYGSLLGTGGDPYKFGRAISPIVAGAGTGLSVGLIGTAMGAAASTVAPAAALVGLATTTYSASRIADTDPGASPLKRLVLRALDPTSLVTNTRMILREFGRLSDDIVAREARGDSVLKSAWDATINYTMSDEYRRYTRGEYIPPSGGGGALSYTEQIRKVIGSNTLGHITGSGIEGDITIRRRFAEMTGFDVTSPEIERRFWPVYQQMALRGPGIVEMAQRVLGTYGYARSDSLYGINLANVATLSQGDLLSLMEDTEFGADVLGNLAISPTDPRYARLMEQFGRMGGFQRRNLRMALGYAQNIAYTRGIGAGAPNYDTFVLNLANQQASRVAGLAQMAPYISQYLGALGLTPNQPAFQRRFDALSGLSLGNAMMLASNAPLAMGIAGNLGYVPGTAASTSYIAAMSALPHAQLMTGSFISNLVQNANIPFGRSGEVYRMLMGAAGQMDASTLMKLMNVSFGMTPEAYTLRGGGLFEFAGGRAYQAGTLAMRGLEDWYMGQQRAYQRNEWQIDITRLGRTQQVTRQQWALQDQSLALSRQYEDWQFGMASAENAIQRRIFEMRAGDNRRIRQINRGLDLQQRQWWLEDMNYQGTVSGLQYTWNMEDLQEALRYSTGRERRAIRRQMERAQIMYGLEETQRQTVIGRQQIVWGAQDQVYQIEEEQTNKIIELQRRLYDLQDERLRQQMEFTNQQRQVEDQMRETERKAQIEREEWQLEDIQRQKQYYEEIVWPYQDKTKERQRQIEDAWASYQNLVIASLAPNGPFQKAWEDAIDDMIDYLKDSMNGARNISPMPPSGAQGRRMGGAME